MLGSVRVFVAASECGAAMIVCPCELASQFNTILPWLVLPFITTLPVPFGAKLISALLAVAESVEPIVAPLITGAVKVLLL